MASLRRKRVSESTPFSKAGLDYLGPVKIRFLNNHKKVWVCLFTCMVTRAVHLDIIQDLTAQEFIMCLRRFFAIRGKPSELISDNAPHFKTGIRNHRHFVDKSDERKQCSRLCSRERHTMEVYCRTCPLAGFMKD